MSSGLEAEISTSTVSGKFAARCNYLWTDSIAMNNVFRLRWLFHGRTIGLGAWNRSQVAMLHGGCALMMIIFRKVPIVMHVQAYLQYLPII